MVDNHGVHGTQDLANVLLRTACAFEYVTSHLGDPGRAGEDLADFFAAAAAVAALRRAPRWAAGLSVPGHGRLRRGHDAPGGHARLPVDGISVEEYIRRAADAPARGRRAARGGIPPPVRRGRRRDRCGPGRHGPRGTVASAAMVADRRLGRADLPVHGLWRGRADRDAAVRGRQPADGRGLGFGGEGDLVGAVGTLALGLACGRRPASARSSRSTSRATRCS